jgi:NADP-dependent 3-hydroxy acid dehydrogenase YdfG
LLNGKTALVTGASRGIGASIAEAIAKAGARVALAARTRSALETISSRIGNGAFPVECDLSSRKSIADALTFIEKEFDGPPDIIVNNAGVFDIRTIEDTDPSELDSIIQANLVAPFVIVRSLLSSMKSRGSGHIVTIGSIADRQIFPGNAAYSASKFGSRAFHEVLRAETSGTGIRATLISPAAVDTDAWNGIEFVGTDVKPDRTTMLSPDAVARAVIFALTQPAAVNVDELRLSRS